MRLEWYIALFVGSKSYFEQDFDLHTNTRQLHTIPKTVYAIFMFGRMQFILIIMGHEY